MEFTKKSPGQFDCYAKAADDEPIFTLRANDPLASGLVRAWAFARAGDCENFEKAVNEVHAVGHLVVAQKAANPEKIGEALRCADAMGKWLLGQSVKKLLDAMIRPSTTRSYEIKPDNAAKVSEAMRKAQGGGMPFSSALENIRSGQRMRRKHWGRSAFVFLVPGSTFIAEAGRPMEVIGIGKSVQYHAHIDLHRADGIVMTWVPSQSDMLADDWDYAPKA